MVLHVLPLVMAMSAQSPPPPPQEVKPAIVLQKPAAAQAPRKLYNETADGKEQIDAAVKAAAEDGIRVLVNWGANDDERCGKFSAIQRAPQIATPRYFSDEYKLIYVDVGHLDKNLDAAVKYGAKVAAGTLPYFTVLDAKGKPIANAPADDFAGAEPATLDAGKMAAFLAKYQAPAPDAQAPFKAALSQAKKDGKYVFLWFSAPW